MQGVKILNLENIKRDGLQMEFLQRRLRDAVQRRDMDTCNTDTVVLQDLESVWDRFKEELVDTGTISILANVIKSEEDNL